MGKCGKGTGSRGLHNKKTHQMCRRCGKTTYHIQKKKCASCGYPAAKMRKYNWSEKAMRRRTTGTGDMKYMKVVLKRLRNQRKMGNKTPIMPKYLAEALAAVTPAPVAPAAPTAAA
eukprot:Protomagalhaensia_wolfi_Nauph_80__4711@NODE_4886_length_485_cov_146_060538_g3955_i0_p1_GENE_NODE_4886_length_485_cov_146_060538_g3955_i0NODE_4886_length_485_cov_146_060538_g3955_i0_p1_ORF_typecomplete_len116_score21_12Ribosomal_L37e/PF01907_19/7_1e26DZR/PF12773_7/0_013HypA/PF01155_19/0_3HypA/PF01155_19/1_4e03NOB1_Zn_bind/PF08772_11/0_13Ribosomal_S14/PF00253_21/21Ribosomal_S14/PF00253_21/1_1zfMss51/PF13824_6/5_9zfMss51/PF13824_6/20YhfH/PF14149_6/94YhfH/PF14149_6/3_1_NODE_4886_length_485_cov_146_0